MSLVLIHGASHGAWAWHRVTGLLRDRGVDVVTTDLPGCGRDDRLWSEVTFDEMVEHTCTVLDAQAEPSVLVGHSLGGAVVSQAAEERPDAIQRLVYLSAAIPADGESARESTLTGTPEEVQAALAEAVKVPVSYFDQLDPAALKAYFYGQCSDELVELARMLLVPLLTDVVMQPLRLTPERFGRIPKAFVECLQDAAVPLATQRFLHDRAGCDVVRSLDTDHSPFFSDPTGLADVLAEIAAL